MRRLLFIVLMALMPSMAWSASYEEFTLRNGMQVIVIPNHRVPVVTHMVWYKVGARDEPLGKSGLAHFLEHLMFKGTQTLKPGEFSKIIAQNGGNDNAFTSQDFTAYFQTIAKDKLKLVMRLEAERMKKLKLIDKEIVKERDVVMEERRTRTENDPRSVLLEQMRAAIYRNDPYGIPVIGWAHEIKQLYSGDVRSFYKRYYAPNNAILVVAGDITKKELRPLVNATYGKVSAVRLPKRLKISEPPHVSPIHVSYTDEKVTQAEHITSYLAPSQRSKDSKHAYALTVLSHILGGSKTSRLYQALVADKKKAASVSTYYDEISLGQTLFTVYMMPMEDVTLVELEKALQKEISKLLEDGITEEELKRAKTVLRAEALYGRDSSKGMAFVFGQALVTGLSPDYVESWPEKINKVTTQQVLDAAKLIFKPERSVTGILLPAGGSKAKGRS